MIQQRNMSIRPLTQQTVSREDSYGKYSKDLIWKFEAVEAGDVPFQNKKNVVREC
jgi:hypothetical protein